MTALALFGGAALFTIVLGVAGLAVWAAVFTTPTQQTQWTGLVLHRAGQGIIVAAVAALAAAVLGAVSAFVAVALRGAFQ